MQTRDFFPSEFPERVTKLANPPTHFSVAGDIEAGDKKVVAFVGSREADQEALDFVKLLVEACVAEEAIIVSGGALGVDTAAHEAALDLGARTWSVMGCGRNYTSPPENEKLFDRILASEKGAMIWPFEPERKPAPQNFLARNKILVGLADVVVVGQAGMISGSRSSAAVARKTGKPLWVVPGPPWNTNFAGSLLEIGLGAKMMCSDKEFLKDVFGRVSPMNPRKTKRIVNRSPEEMSLFEAATERPQHLDELCELADLSLSSAATALLTLALEHVLVEGPPGYYRRG